MNATAALERPDDLCIRCARSRAEVAPDSRCPHQFVNPTHAREAAVALTQELLAQPVIPLADCEPRRLYRLRCRNLALGVYDPATQGFIGVREKFGSRYLFTEHHWELGAEGFGTAKPLEALEVLPAEIELREIDHVDRASLRAVVEDAQGWRYLDTGEHDPAIISCWTSHQPLLAYLERRLVELGLRPEQKP